MPAPSKSWVTITDSQVDADSPLDTTLVTGLRDDVVHLREWLGKDYTAAQNHAHNGVDSAQVSYADIPKTVGVELFDDFLTMASLDAKWANIGGLSAQVDGVGGKARLTGTAGTESNGIGMYSNRHFQLSGGNTLTFELKVKLGAVVSNYYYFGFMDSMLETSQVATNGIMFLSTASSALKVTTISGGTAGTVTDTGLTWVANTEYTLKIVASASSVKFYVNGVLKATHTTNIPTAVIGIGAIMRNSAASCDVDYILASSSARL